MPRETQHRGSARRLPETGSVILDVGLMSPATGVPRLKSEASVDVGPRSTKGLDVSVPSPNLLAVTYCTRFRAVRPDLHCRLGVTGVSGVHLDVPRRTKSKTT